MQVFGFENYTRSVARIALADIEIDISVREYRMQLCAFVLAESDGYSIEFALQFLGSTSDPMYLGLRMPLWDCISSDGHLQSTAIHIVEGFATEFAQQENLPLSPPT